ncbi:MAG: SixA phosphatase family protein [Acidimicrobiales bacterium]
MSRVVQLLRHAKAARPPGYADHERPLNERGRHAAALIGRFLAVTGQAPDLAVCSTAERAADTLDRVLHAAGCADVAVERTDELYDAGPVAYYAVLRRLAPHVRSVLLVGHEPGISETAISLAGGGSLAVPTCGLVRLDYAGAWSELRPGAATLSSFVRPRLLERVAPS